jgi:hypothetical protein
LELEDVNRSGKLYVFHFHEVGLRAEGMAAVLEFAFTPLYWHIRNDVGLEDCSLSVISVFFLVSVHHKPTCSS